MTLLLSGCSASVNGNTGLQRQIPTTCEGILQEVPQPGVTKQAEVTIARHRYALKKANSNITDGRNCIGFVRREFSVK
jgi:hypothetical protein